MALLEITTEQILKLIQQLPPEGKRAVLESLRHDATSELLNPELDPESKAWLEADLAGDLPEYDWGPEGIPEGVPIVCTDEGIMIVGADKVES